LSALLAAPLTDSQNFADFYQFYVIYGVKTLNIILCRFHRSCLRLRSGRYL